MRQDHSLLDLAFAIGLIFVNALAVAGDAQGKGTHQLVSRIHFTFTMRNSYGLIVRYNGGLLNSAARLRKWIE